MPARRLSAPWLLPIAEPPMADGAVLVAEDGRIATVGPDRHVPRPPGVAEEHFPNALLMPGLVNTHTHVELTGFAGRIDEDHFTRWIRQVRHLKELRPEGEVRDAAREGLRRSFAAGVTTIAETGDTGAVVEALADLGGRGVVFHEVFGPHPDQVEGSLQHLQERIEELRPYTGPAVRLGVSPHAPYTVSGALYRAVATWARAADLAMAVHIAESAAETALLADGTGPFREAWDARGIPAPDPLGDSPVAWLDRHGVLAPGTLCIHCVAVGPEDIALLVRHGCAVAHCPRSNRRHGHGHAPLAALLDAGVPVGVGTDSEASAELDLLGDVRLAAELADLDGAAALDLVTRHAARALGWEGEIGELRAGAWGDIVVRDLPTGWDGPGSALAGMLVREAPAVRATFIAGAERFRAPSGVSGP